MMSTRLARPLYTRRALTSVVGALLTSVAIAGAAVAVSTAGDGATATAATAKAKTVLDMSWGDTTPVAGQKVLLYGFAFPAVTGRVLDVQTLTGSTSWKTVGSVKSTANGSFTVYLQHTVAGSHRYRLLAPATATTEAATSPTAGFTVSKRPSSITAAVSAGSVSRNRAVTVTGTVKTDFTARTVAVFLRRAGKTTWSRVGRVTLNASGRYSLTVPTSTAGSWLVRTHVYRTSYARAATSPTVSLRVTAP
ncbi:MAG: hypothetical protein QOF53_496 [Nocardioidaceae bacterium]|jgi:hypothetical protein|nr:hypothetical protein [Nocardioidaceae bacterium]